MDSKHYTINSHHFRVRKNEQEPLVLLIIFYHLNFNLFLKLMNDFLKLPKRIDDAIFFRTRLFAWMVR